MHKRTEATVTAADGTTFRVTKGAPQVILALAANAAQITPAADKAVNDFAARGFRSLGVARADGDGDWQFVGVLPLFDPPRDDAAATISTAAAMGVTIKMVTGDALAIAKETAAKIGLGTDILDAAGLGDTKKDESAAVAESIETADGFAQVFPEHKYHIVDVLQKRGHIVGMTGDGVNDAPALKKADCGIAVSGATDAARAAADIVLLTPGLSVIIDAIKESRKIFQRMNSYAIYRIAETLRVLLFMTAAILVFNFYPVTAIMIVMLALLNDGAILSIAYDNVRYRNEPEAWNMRLVLGICHRAWASSASSPRSACSTSANAFSASAATHVQTLMYLKLSVAGHLTIFLTRTRGPFWSIRPARILLIAVCGTQAIATLIAVYGLFMAPLGWKWAAVGLGIRPRLVPHQRPHQTLRLPHPRPRKEQSRVRSSACRARACCESTRPSQPPVAEPSRSPGSPSICSRAAGVCRTSASKELPSPRPPAPSATRTTSARSGALRGRNWGSQKATTHSFRKTVATLIDDEGLSARIAPITSATPTSACPRIAT